MTATQGDLAALSRYIFRAPRWYSSLAFALLIAAVAGVAAFDFRFVLEDAWQGVFFIGVPTIIASALTPWIDGKLGGQLTRNRASLLALAGELVIIAFLIVAGVIAVFTPLGQGFVFDTLLASLASVFALRLLVVMAVSRKSILIASIPASIQTVATAVLLFIYSGTMRYFEIGGPLAQSYLSRPERAPPELLVIVPQDFVVLGVICVLYAAAVWAFISVIDRPWRRSMNVSVLDFIRGFIGHIAEGSRELETFFEDIGEEAVVPVTVLSFRTPGGREKARFTLPMIHPGPMGEIGGGNLPERVAAWSEGVAFPPHATAGHDFNLVTEHEVDSILDAATEAFDALTYDPVATQSVRKKIGDATLIGQAFGDNALLVSTFSPNFADDVEFSIGMTASAEARVHGLKNVMLVDAHNSNNGLTGPDLGHVVPGSKRSYDMIQAASAVADGLTRARRGPVKLGVAWDRTPWTPPQGIGPLGVRVAMIEVEEQVTAYVLVDGNNMEPGLRDRIVAAIPDVDDAEVMTTDTHVVNTIKSANQVGSAIPHDELVDLIVSLVEKARADVEAVEAGMATSRAEVTVFGNDRTETLASHANALMSMGGALAAAFIIVVFGVSVLIFLLA